MNKGLKTIIKSIALSFLMLLVLKSNAQVKLLSEVEITDEALYFDGVQDKNSTKNTATSSYDYAYGKSINPHGDCIKTYKQFVFLTWYRGGKGDRHVMLTRYNTVSGTMKTIEFPHQHTGYNGKWWIGETHNTIAIGICPRNGTIHLAYDMHAYGNSGPFLNDYFRYSYSQSNVADIADDEFTLDKFVKDPIDGDYRHCTMSGVRNPANFSRMTYPKFFLNTEGELFLTMRRGSSHDGGQAFIKYDDAASKWGLFKQVTTLGAKAKGETHDWSIYGQMKFSNGKMRLGFQRRLRNTSDKYQYQNGVYYAYSDDPTGASQWKNYKGEPMTFPLVKAAEVLIIEPGDWVKTTQKDKVYIVGGFDFEVTDRGDEHIVSMVKDNQFKVTKKLHTYRKAGDAEFKTVTYNAGSELYAAGNDIYVIGLKNGRANVVKTVGGTSNFKQVYQHSSGLTFDKGVVHINNGKLFYYLLKKGGSGDKRSTYLQVFDLDIDTTTTDTSRDLSFKNVYNNQEIELGASLSIEANVGSAFKEVTLWSGSTNLGTKTSAPFVWSGHSILTDMNEDSYTFKLVAKDSDDVVVERTVIIKTKIPSSNVFTGQGRYKFYNPNKLKWMGFDVATDDALVTDMGDADNNKFNVVANGEKYNIFTNDNQKVVVIETSSGFTSKLADPSKEVLASGDALFSFEETEAGSEKYFITSGAVDSGSGNNYRLNVKSGGTDIGRGTTGLPNYQWEVTKIGDLVSGVETQNVHNQELKVYPNPAKDILYFEGYVIKSAKVYSLSGKLLHSYVVNSNQISIPQLKSGLYLLKLEDNKGQAYSNKLVVE